MVAFLQKATHFSFLLSHCSIFLFPPKKSASLSLALVATATDALTPCLYLLKHEKHESEEEETKKGPDEEKERERYVRVPHDNKQKMPKH